MPDDAKFWPRFSLRAILLAFVAIAVGCALLFSVPDVVAVPGLILVIVTLPALLTSGIIYGSRRWRAFCIGALFPTGLALYALGWLFGLLFVEGPAPLNDFSDWRELVEQIGFQLRFYAAASWVMALFVGSLVAYVSHRAARRDDGEF